jgi:hypothetical protein
MGLRPFRVANARVVRHWRHFACHDSPERGHQESFDRIEFPLQHRHTRKVIDHAEAVAL